jgi:alpha-1,2-mannosyltransferase
MHDTTAPDPGSTGHRGRLAPVLLFVGLFLVYAPTISHSQLSLDVFGTNWTTWHLAATGHPWIDGANIPELHEHQTRVLIVDGQNGHSAFGRFPGAVVAALPAYLVAQSATMTTVPGGLTAAVLTALAVVLMFLALRRHLPARLTWLSTLVFALATPMWSVSANGMWPHTLTLLGISGMAWAATNGRWWWVGIFGGVTLWGRLHAVLITAAFGLLLGRHRRDLGIVVRVAVASGAFLVGYCAWVRYVYGTWNPVGAYGSGSDIVQGGQQYWVDPVNQLGMWIAPDRGILVWTPIVALLLPALARSWRELPDWSRSLLISGLVYTLIENELNTFTGGDVFYGYRYGLEFLGCAVPALALSAPRTGAVARWLAGPVLAVELLATALGAIPDGNWLFESAAWHDNAFVHTVNGVGTGGWVFVALFAACGAGVGAAWRRADRSGTEAPESAHEDSSGTPVGSNAG